MRDARELHADLKRAASLKVMQQQQVEAEEQQSIPEEPRSGLRGSLSSAVKTHLGFGKHSSKGGTPLAALYNKPKDYKGHLSVDNLYLCTRVIVPRNLGSLNVSKHIHSLL